MIERERLTQGTNPEIEDLSAMYEVPRTWLREIITGVGSIEQRVQCTGETKKAGDEIVHGYRFDGNFVPAAFQIWEPIQAGVHEPPERARAASMNACGNEKRELQRQIDAYESELIRIDDLLTALGQSPGS